MSTIEELRHKIEQTDTYIIKKLAERLRLSKQIGELKAEEGLDIIDLSQEKKLFDYYDKLSKKHNLQSSFVKRLFKLIIASSRGVQKENQFFWVYILLCENDTYYTGYTTDLAKRYKSHVDGTGRCKYTRSFKPLNIAQSWKIEGNKALAMKIERQIKKLSRAEKEKIIALPSMLKIYF